MESLELSKENYFINTPDNIIPEFLTSEILKKNDASEYHASLPAYKPTPLVSLPDLARHYEVGKIFLKDESYRFGLNAFKVLGASYAVFKLLEKSDNIPCFCTATDGNHGRAVAWAARSAGKKAVVYVPKDTVKSRIEAIESEGAKVIVTAYDYDETCRIAKDNSINNGWQLVQDTSWEGYEEIPAYIMSGYLTQFREMENSIHSLPNPGADVVFLQAGVGSWAGAAVWYYLNRYGKNRPKLIVVEPMEADGILASFKKGHRVEPNGNYQTIMAGLNCGLPSLSAWEIIKHGADVSLKIPDFYACEAMRKLYYNQGADHRIISGESGAGGLAGFIALMSDPNLKELKEYLGINHKTSVLVFNTEGATDPVNFNKIVASEIT